VKDEFGLTLSIGVSWNKTYAKLGSDYKKPDAITHIAKDNYKNILYPLPVDSMLFVGRKTKRLFERFNILTIGDLAEFDAELLKPFMGINAVKLVSAARGDDDEEVADFHTTDPVKSVGNGATISRDLVTTREVEQAIYVLAEEVGTRMRRKRVKGFTISLSLRGEDLRWHGAQESVSIATNSALTITEVAMHILPRLWDVKNPLAVAPVHSLRVAVSNLTKDHHAQLDLFNDGTREDRNDKFSSLFDKIRKKHGSAVLSYATALGSELGLEFEVIDQSFQD
jgi:DNA polymerase-4